MYTQSVEQFLSMLDRLEDRVLAQMASDDERFEPLPTQLDVDDPCFNCPLIDRCPGYGSCQ